MERDIPPDVQHREFVGELNVPYPLARQWPGPPQCTSTWSSRWLTQLRARKRRHFPTPSWHARCSSVELSQSFLELVTSDYLLPDAFTLARTSQVLSNQVNADFEEEISGGHEHRLFHWSSWSLLRNCHFSCTSLQHAVVQMAVPSFFWACAS